MFAGAMGFGSAGLVEAIEAPEERRAPKVSFAPRAQQLLRRAGFKLRAHVMPNLLGSTQERDVWRGASPASAFTSTEPRERACNVR